MVMALVQAGFSLPSPAGVQPEDHLTAYLTGPDGRAALARFAPWAVGQDGRILYPPNEVHACLAWGVNKLLGKRVVDFSTDVDVDEILHHLASGAGVVLSGSFPVRGGELNHVVSLSGYKACRRDARFGDLDCLYIDDPYGNYHTGYKDHQGNDVSILPRDFMQIIKQPKARRKWAHIVGGRV